MIHPSAIISSRAQISDDVVVGPFSVVAENVVIDSGCHLASHVTVASGSRIGKNNHFYSFCSVGDIGQHLNRPSGDECFLVIGKDNVFREYCTLNKGLLSDDKTTRIGSRNYIMSHTHFGHDSIVGNSNLIAGGVQCAGHVAIGDHINIGYGVMIHQFCHIGNHAVLHPGSMVVHNVPAFTSVSGSNARARSVNLVGMKRQNFSQQQINNIRRAFRICYRQNKSLSQAIEVIRSQCDPGEEINVFVESLSCSDRGIIRYRSRQK